MKGEVIVAVGVGMIRRIDVIVMGKACKVPFCSGRGRNVAYHTSDNPLSSDLLFNAQKKKERSSATHQTWSFDSDTSNFVQVALAPTYLQAYHTAKSS